MKNNQPFWLNISELAVLRNGKQKRRFELIKQFK